MAKSQLTLHGSEVWKHGWYEMVHLQNKLLKVLLKTHFGGINALTNIKEISESNK